MSTVVVKVLHLNKTDLNGGAARAAHRIHHALRGAGVDSHMLADNVTSGDWTVQGPNTNLARVLARFKAAAVSELANRMHRTGNPIIHSPAMLPSSVPRRIAGFGPDVIHLQWIADEMLSIRQIGMLDKPVVWTLHDMWPFCGAEHYAEDRRWADGYFRSNRPGHESGFDINRWTWKRKVLHWRRSFNIVTPSRWMTECVRASALMSDWPVTEIPNALDTDIWKPIDKTTARRLLQLPEDMPLLIFGAMGGGRDPRKGFDLLLEALGALRDEMIDLELAVFGQFAPKEPTDLGFPVYYTGHLHDDLSLRVLYSAADALVIPSRQDNLPNTGVEALACGTPVVAFDTCGLPDIVKHERTGYLAKAFDIEDLARGIRWVLSDVRRLDALRHNARAFAVERFSYPVVAQQYLDVYRRAMFDQ